MTLNQCNKTDNLNKLYKTLALSLKEKQKRNEKWKET